MPQNAIIASAILIALAAFINVLPGVSDAFALITASSSGVYIAIYILIMVAHFKIPQVTRLHGGWLPHASVSFAQSLPSSFCLVFVTSLQSRLHGAVGSAIWILVFGIYSQWKFRK